MKNKIKEIFRKIKERAIYEQQFEKDNWNNFFKKHYLRVIAVIILAVLIGFYYGEIKMCEDSGGFITLNENKYVTSLTCTNINLSEAQKNNPINDIHNEIQKTGFP